MQQCSWAWGGCPPAQAEECLYVNVFTPRAAAVPANTSSLPVIAWIHGGDYIFGHIGSPMYNASALAADGLVVVVTLQYRLGVWGTLYDGDAGGNVTGNYGLTDQIAALRWIAANAAAFGGDPTRVTVVGQSAGGISVATLLASPSAAGLFAGAVVHSDPFAIPLHTPNGSIAAANTLASKAGCGSTAGTPAGAACLLALSPADLLTAQVAAAADIIAMLPYALLYAGLPWSPTTGTPDLPLAPLDAFTDPAAYVADVPVMMGTVTDEVRGLVPTGFNLSSLEYSLFMLAIFGGDAGTAILNHYPTPTPPPSNFYDAFCSVGTAGTFHCAVRNASLALSARPGRKSSTYLYHYDHVLSWAPYFWGPNGTACWDYVCHTADVLLLFQPQYPALNATYTPAEASLASAMHTYWSNFAASGDPGAGGSGGAPVWPPLPFAGGVSDIPSLYLSTSGITVLNATFDGAECAFWDADVGYHPY